MTSLLLRMEEVGRKLQEPSSPNESCQPANAAAAAEQEEESPSKETSSTPESSKTSSSNSSQDSGSEPSEMEWSFSFEQVLASLLNEPAVVTFFERPIDFQAKLGQAKVAQLRLTANKKLET